MRGRWLIPLCLPSMALAAISGVCNHTGFYLGETHVVLTVLSSGVADLHDERPTVRPQCGETTVERNLIHRVFPDLAGKPSFGYNLLITRDPVKRTFRITVAKPGNGLVSFSKLPDPVTIGDGDRVDVPVLENPKTGARILDSYAITLNGTGVAPLPMTQGFPSYAPSGALLSLQQPHLRSETSDLGENPQFGVSGPVVWLYSRWLGRVLFSATPRAGYRRLGVAEGSAIRFSDGVEHYRLALHGDAVPAAGVWWLWVKREPEFQPPPGPWTGEELHRGMLALGAER
jgi:hypothetical protein